ncbi:PEGA domain-containing protein [Pseudothermotoga thermarum]|uniref:PEGA domain protein n=1 Tax=Pseudothermotoga thermarum DSM 5069 TaxID=688269 RepID=F7YUW4_9THEM|nr:PEGA domain-containing protein [Pseudothermotoga thermarum]AEH51524.1 PEGA domain protein [Pseudothermotoga thermarum DSM 5069]
MIKAKFLAIFAILCVGVIALGQVLVVVQAEPFSMVYLNDIYYGMVGIDGKLEITLTSYGQYRVRVVKDWFVAYESVVYTSPNTRIVIAAQMKRAGALRIFSNVYPVEVYIEGKFIGRANSVKDLLYVPEGTQYVTFKSDGYIPETRMLTFNYTKETAVNINLIPEALMVDLKIEPEAFSPNGDWYKDTTTFYIYLSKPAQLVVEAIDQNKNVVWSWRGKGKSGTNTIIWTGVGLPDGTYEIRVTALTDSEAYYVSRPVTIDRSVYTYTKEITLTVLGIGLFGVLLFFLLSTSQ